MSAPFWDKLLSCVPTAGQREIDWPWIEEILALCNFGAMEGIPQNPVYHGEGDVLTHTKLACRALSETPTFYALPERQRAELFLAALLHDIGKGKTTRWENDAWISPHHASTGSRMVREFLWRDSGLCGTKEAQTMRETVCALVRYHMLPVRLPDQPEPERKLREIAAIGEPAADFSLELLCLLAEADVRGRIAEDREDCLTQVGLTRLLAEDAGCLHGPYPFADGYTRRAYLSGRKVAPDQPLFDTAWGEVILLSGLPGTGKDTWIRENYCDLPMISLDVIRKEMGVSPAGEQGTVAQAAQERARAYLRRKQPFVWNATDLTRDARQRLVSLFESYGARVRIVWLETAWNEELWRNAGRKDAVPTSVIEAMLQKTTPPTPDEAQAVEWVCV